jgi:exodeoxyribonuclease-3
VVHHESVNKGRAGVAVASRAPIVEVVTDLAAPGADCTGRWIEATVDTPDGRGLTVVSAYAHTGDATDPGRMAEKLSYLRTSVDRMAKIAATGRHALLTGDLNIAHHEVDIKNWKGNVGKAGFLPEERAELDRLLDAGFVDLGRAHGGGGPGPYTWWTYRGQAYDTDAGWRIDYHLASADLAALATHVVVDRTMAYADRWSDHAPVTAFLEF